MQKFKTTKKEMKNRYDQILSVGYCDAQYLLKYESPIAYSTRSEGWACDYYEVNGILISTGYSPLDDRNTKHDYNLLKGYEDQAREIACDYNKGWEEQKEEIDQLLKQFINEVVL